MLGMSRRAGTDCFIHAASRCNLRRLMLLRNFTIVGLTFAVVMESDGRLAIDLPTAAFASVIGFLVLFNLATFWRLRRSWHVTDLELLGHIFADIGALAVLLYFSGGPTSPLVALLLVFVAIAGASVPWAYSLCAALLAVGCYALLEFFHVPLRGAGSEAQDLQLVAFSMCMNYAVGAGLIVYFVGAIATLLREQATILAEARDREANHDYLIRVGSLVTGAAHEIRSSLATMSVLVKDLLLMPHDRRSLGRDLRIISDQIEACRHSLSDLIVGGESVAIDAARCESVKVFLRDVVDRWESLRPAVKLACRWRGTQPPPEIHSDRCLAQAILNLLDNAADAAPDDEIEMNCDWSPAALKILVQDRGLGISPLVDGKVGERLLTTKHNKGIGIGLLLAKTAIERFGGTLKLSNRPGGGACAEVILPLEVARMLPKAQAVRLRG
jgi:two-component system, sensor histidine kinase RegB